MQFISSLFEDDIRKMVAICIDAHLKAMSEIFSCSSAHARMYCNDFVPNVYLQFFQIVWLISEHFLLQMPQEKSHMLKSSERGGHSTSPLRETRRDGHPTTT